MTISLIIFVIAVIGFAIIGAYLHLRGMRRLSEVERRLGLPATGLFRQTLLEMSAILRHDGEDFQELDALMDKANDPTSKMTDEEDERLLSLLHERTTSQDSSLRKGERRVATAYPIVLELARLEAANPGALTGITRVGTQAPSGLSAKDRAARQGNVE